MELKRCTSPSQFFCPFLLSHSYLVLSFECLSFLQWLRSFDQRLRESIDYAICLNSVGSLGNQSHLHVSKPPENAYIQQIFQVCNKCHQWEKPRRILYFGTSTFPFLVYKGWFMQGFSTVAEELGLQVRLKHKKINISNPRVSIYTS